MISHKKPTFKNYNLRTEQWNWETISKLPPFQRNRDTEPRVNKLLNALKTFSPSQLNMHVGVALNNFGNYKKGDMFLLDGNTRVLLYTKYPDLLPPYPFNVTIYEFDNLQDAINMYYSLDNSSAAENSNEKITGLHREKNYKPISKIFKTGRYKNAVDVASTYALSNKNLPLRHEPFEEKLDYFWEQIQFLDSMNFDTFKRTSSNVIGCFLMVGKKYRVKNDEFVKLVDNYKNGYTTQNDNKGMDGVHYVYNVLYDNYRSVWTVTGFSRTDLITKILYSFDLFIQGKTIPRKFPNEAKLRRLLQEYLIA